MTVLVLEVMTVVVIRRMIVRACGTVSCCRNVALEYDLYRDSK